MPFLESHGIGGNGKMPKAYITSERLLPPNNQYTDNVVQQSQKYIVTSTNNWYASLSIYDRRNKQFLRSIYPSNPNLGCCYKDHLIIQTGTTEGFVRYNLLTGEKTVLGQTYQNYNGGKSWVHPDENAAALITAGCVYFFDGNGALKWKTTDQSLKLLVPVGIVNNKLQIYSKDRALMYDFDIDKGTYTSSSAPGSLLEIVKSENGYVGRPSSGGVTYYDNTLQPVKSITNREFLITFGTYNQFVAVRNTIDANVSTIEIYNDKLDQKKLEVFSMVGGAAFDSFNQKSITLSGQGTQGSVTQLNFNKL